MNPAATWKKAKHTIHTTNVTIATAHSIKKFLCKRSDCAVLLRKQPGAYLVPQAAYGARRSQWTSSADVCISLMDRHMHRRRFMSKTRQWPPSGMEA